MRRPMPFLAVFLLVTVASPSLDGGPVAAAPGPGLFAPSPESGGPVPGYASRARTAALTVDLESAPSPLEITLDPFEDVAVAVTLERMDRRGYGASWRGSVSGTPGHTVMLTVSDGILWGSAVLPTGRYAFEPGGPGSVRIVEAGGVPPIEAEPIDIPLGDAAPPSRATGSRTTARLDVLVLYTPAVEAILGGSGPAQIYAQARIDELTNILADSEVDAAANLVHAAETTDTEVGRSTTQLLYALGCDGPGDARFGYMRPPNDGTLRCSYYAGGLFDEVHALRDAYGADLVTLIVDQTSTGGGSSIAFTMGSDDPAYEFLAFSVVNYDQATLYYSMSHEIGHNLGSRHDRINSSGSPAYEYMYGYRWPGRWHTVMSYWCDPDGTSNCSPMRIPYFSNPSVDYDDGSGVLATGSSAPGDEADNAAGFGFTTQTVEGYRSAGDTCNGLAATITGGAGDDVLTGTGGDDVIMGFDGNDTIDGKGGSDTICAGNGADRIIGGFGADWIDGEGGRNDWVDYLDAPSGVTVDLVAGTAAGGHGNDTIANVEHIKGSTHDDVLTGSPKDNRIFGFQGGDVIDGRAGDDVVDGGPGNDSIRGHRGDDEIVGSLGRDTAEFSEATGPVTVDLEAGTGRYGGFGDTLSGIEHVRGSRWNDLLKGDDFDNVLRGIGGDDDLRGRAGFDYLLGGTGTDKGVGGLGGASCVNIEFPTGC